MTLAKTTKYAKVSLTELKALVEGAKNCEVDATERLCDQFKFLIKEEVGRSYIKNILGEDAENDAWVLFFEAVQKYDRKGISSFPSFAKKYIHFKLINLVFRNKYVQNTISLDNFTEDYNDLEPADPKNYFDVIENKNLFENFYALLTEKQHLVLQGFAAGKGVDAIARELNITINCVYAHKKNALRLLKTYCKNEYITY